MSWATTTTAKPVVLAGEDERQLKLAYAALLVANSGDASEAAYALFPGEHNYGRAWGVAQNWPQDPLVAAEVNRIALAGELPSFLPSDDQIIKTIWDEGNNATDPKIKLQYRQLMAEVVGLKQTGVNVNNNTLVQNVIEVPTRATEGELPMLESNWAEQQRQLVADARSTRPN